MKLQRYIISAAAVFVFLFVYDMLVHGQLLMEQYVQTSQTWRSDVEMQTLLPWAIVVKFALAATMTWLFTRHFEGGGIQEGIRFGFYIGLLLGILQFGAYLYLPIPITLALSWLAVYVLQGIGAGIVLSLTYKS